MLLDQFLDACESHFFSRWDHLYIWDGDNIFSGLQAVYSGLVKTKDKSYKTSSMSEVLKRLL